MQRRSAYPPRVFQTLDQGGRSMRRGRFGKRAAALVGTLAIGSLASPAMAELEPRAKLVRCGSESCLQIAGYRNDPAMTVSLNGHTVSAEGKNGWRVRLPIDTARQWSTPNARTIEVSLRHPETEQETSAVADLPIGLFGGITNLPSLNITAP